MHFVGGDQLGDMDDAIDQACQLANIQSTPEIIMLREIGIEPTRIDVTNSPSVHSIIPIRVPGLEKYLTTFLYLWQPEPIVFSGLRTSRRRSFDSLPPKNHAKQLSCPQNGHV